MTKQIAQVKTCHTPLDSRFIRRVFIGRTGTLIAFTELTK